jgi:hypothetical protein
MTTITLPPDLEGRLADEARRRGTTPELLALDGLRRLFTLPTADAGANGATLFDFLAGHVGAVAGSTEPLSEDCGVRFADGLEEQRRGRP